MIGLLLHKWQSKVLNMLMCWCGGVSHKGITLGATLCFTSVTYHGVAHGARLQQPRLTHNYIHGTQMTGRSHV